MIFDVGERVGLIAKFVLVNKHKDRRQSLNIYIGN